jgi:hypothetical protein
MAFVWGILNLVLAILTVLGVISGEPLAWSIIIGFVIFSILAILTRKA